MTLTRFIIVIATYAASTFTVPAFASDCAQAAEGLARGMFPAGELNPDTGGIAYKEIIPMPALTKTGQIDNQYFFLVHDAYAEYTDQNNQQVVGWPNLRTGQIDAVLMDVPLNEGVKPAILVIVENSQCKLRQQSRGTLKNNSYTPTEIYNP